MLALVAPPEKKIRVEEVDGMVWVYVVDHHTATAPFDELVEEAKEAGTYEKEGA